MKNNIILRIISFMLSALLCIPAAMPVFAEEENIIYIETADDLRRIAKKCSLDSFSTGKTFILTDNINLGGQEFTSIALFGGTFDGGGHTISGIKLTGSSSSSGFFNRILEGAEVKNLNLSGTISVGDKQKYAGGISGENSGKITNCSFSGMITGGISIGGAAGINRETGEIYGFVNSAYVTGTHLTGGVAGENNGVVSSCTNKGSINITYTDAAYSLKDINFDITKINSTENINASTDTGGIAGYSNGLILGCFNQGAVGYEHVGYNCGGIAGRSAGVISNCKNIGRILGRKDVGGICGQAEPVVILDFSEDTLTKVRKHLDNITEFISKISGSANSAVNDVSSDIEEISAQTERAKKSLDTISYSAENFADSNISEINRVGSVISDAFKMLVPVCESSYDAVVSLGDGLRSMEEAAKELENTFRCAEDVIDKSEIAALGFSEAFASLSDASSDAADSVENFQYSYTYFADAAGIIAKYVGSVKNKLGDIKDGISDALEYIESLFQSLAHDETDNTSENLEGLADTLEEIGDSVMISAENIGGISDALGPASDAESIVKEKLDDLRASLEKAAEALKSASSAVKTIKKDIESGMRYADISFSLLKDSLVNISEAAKEAKIAMRALSDAAEATKDVTTSLQKESRLIANAFSELKDASESLSDAVSKTGDVADYISKADKIAFSSIDSDGRAATDNLLDSVSEINNGVKKISSSLKDFSDEFKSDFDAITEEVSSIYNTVIDALYARNDSGIEDIYNDSSKDNIENSSTGIIILSENHGNVNGDLNVGGIAGCMAIEYDFDPEEDIIKSGGSTFNRTYEARCVIRDCINDGEITAKKNSVGGVAGKMSIGAVYGCENYGNIKTETGEYAGGIAGLSDSYIANSYSKCTLSGKRYIGGICGYGSRVDNNVALVVINGAESFFGAISGDDHGEYRGNLFVSDTLAALDKYSYEGKGEPVDYTELMQYDKIPERFRYFTVKYIADGKIVSQEKYNWRDIPVKEKLPEIPEKDGYYGYWDTNAGDRITYDMTVNCVYSRYLTTVASEEKDGEKPLFLIEGVFTEFSLPSCERIENEYAKRDDVIAAWHITIPTNSGGNKIRLLKNDETGMYDSAEIYIKSTDGYTKAECKEIGSYMATETDENEFDLLVVHEKQTFPVKYIILASVCAAVILAVLIFTAIKRKKRKKA